MWGVALRARIAVQSGAWAEADRLLASILRDRSSPEALVAATADALAMILPARRGLPVDDEWLRRLGDRPAHRRDIHVAWLEAQALAQRVRRRAARDANAAAGEVAKRRICVPG